MRLAATPALDQRGLGGVGAVLAQRQIVFGGAAVVAVAADDDADVGMGDQVGRGLGRGGLALGPQGVAVVVEEDTSATFWWKTSSEPISAVAAPAASQRGLWVATGTRTVTRTLASVAPPSPLATEVEVGGGGRRDGLGAVDVDRPMPSMATDVALVVRQLRTTDWPRSMASGSAVRLAVGAGVGAVGWVRGLQDSRGLTSCGNR
jgi:hypothetical protein